MEKKSYTFPKSEKLCSVKDITPLFKGKSIFAFPLKVGYNITLSQATSVQVVCSVGKRYSKRAVKRNKIKRRIREAYRLTKYTLIDSLKPLDLKVSVKVAFIYVSPNEESYETIQKAMEQILHKLGELSGQIANSSTTPSA